MKIKVNAGFVDITGLTPDEFDVMLGIVEASDRQCFKDHEENIYYSGGDLTLSISDSQRAALTRLGNRIRDIYNS